MSTPVTVSISRETSPARIGDAMEWVNDGLELARHFAGSLGGGMLRDADDANVVHVIYRFADTESLERWEQSEERMRWLASGEALVLDAKVQRRTGVEGWFDGAELRHTVNEQTGAINTVGVRSAPVRWKQAVAIWMGMLPLNILVATAVSFLPWWSELPLPLRSVLSVTATVPLMTFFMMPMVTRVLRPWLRRNPGVIQSERALLEALNQQTPRG